VAVLVLRSAGQGAFSWAGTGVSTADGSRGVMDGRLAFEGEQPVEMDMIFVGDEFWLRSGAIPLPRGKRWIHSVDRTIAPETLTPRSSCASMKVWVGRDGLPLRVSVALRARDGSVDMVADVLESGVPVEAEPPPARRVIEESELG
jgi:hypothetical protein